jgi:hypothetical protein
VEKEHAARSPFKMLVGKGYSWKAAKARLPPSRQIIHTVRNPRFLLSLGLVTAVVLLWRSMGSAAGEMQRYVRRLVQWHTKLYRLPCVQVGSNC